MNSGQETHDLVPFLDLARIHSPMREVLLEAFGELIDDGDFANGAAVVEFESAFASACGTSSCAGVASGLDALRLTLAAAGVGPGDEVIVPAMTFVATYEAVIQVGAYPVPVDIGRVDYCLDADATRAAITDRTRAILPVHLYGQMADMHALRAMAETDQLLIVEDAAQSHGAARGGLKAGGAGHAAGFSFYPSKNLGAMGDAGAVTSNDIALLDGVRMLREHGQAQKYDHLSVGYTSRLDTIQALVLRHKLPFLERWNAQRHRIASTYLHALVGVGDLVLPPIAPESNPVWHVFVVRTGCPEELAAHLAQQGISTGRHYPIAPYASQAYAHLGYRPEAFPVAQELASTGISLPIFPGMLDSEIELVVQATSDFFDRRAHSSSK